MKHTYGKVITTVAFGWTAWQYFFGKDWQYWAFLTICLYLAFISILVEEK